MYTWLCRGWGAVHPQDPPRIATANGTIACLMVWGKWEVHRTKWQWLGIEPKVSVSALTTEVWPPCQPSALKLPFCFMPSTCVFVSALEFRDLETALYDRTYVFSLLCSIFQMSKRWLRALQLKAVTIAYEYTLHGPWIYYQDYEY